MLSTKLGQAPRLRAGLALATAGLLNAALLAPFPTQQPTRSVIVQGSDLARVKSAALAAGGTITHEPDVIRGVAVALSAAQIATLKAAPGVTRVFDNPTVEIAAKPVKNGTDTESGRGGQADTSTYFPQLVDADLAHQQGIDGAGVTSAVLDTGVWEEDSILENANEEIRILATYDATLDEQLLIGSDDSGHGSHVTSIAASKRKSDGHFNGIAPSADLLIVNAFDANGQASYADVIRGIDWILSHREQHNIRVLNLSLSATPQSHYWDDPLNQAVLSAWQAGIVVVASAGNGGPEPMSVGVPGNLPYVITVGAMTDSYTPADGSDDVLASFSAAGPTHEGFVKPEMVGPGGHMLGVMNRQSQISRDHGEFREGNNFFRMSGTSQSAAVVSGIAALLLQADPTLTPDDVKCRLMASARAARHG